MDKKVQVKIMTGGEGKETALPATLSDLVARVKELFPALALGPTVVRYIDEDGDIITIGTEVEYKLLQADISTTDPLFTFIINDKTNSITTEEKKEEIKKFNISEAPMLDSVLVNEKQEAKPEKKPEAKPEEKPQEQLFPSLSSVPNIHDFTNKDPIPTVTPGDQKVISEDSSKEERKGFGVPRPAVSIYPGNIPTKDASTVDNEKKEVCPSCEGRLKGKKGGQCKKCNGTGVIPASLAKFIKKKIQKEVEALSIKLSEIQLSKTQDQMKMEEIKSVVEKSAIIDAAIKCFKCKEQIAKGDPVFSCILCKDFIICEACEKKEEHKHALVKGRIAGKKMEFKGKLKGQCSGLKNIIPGDKFQCIVTVKNAGHSNFPVDTCLKSVDEKIGNLDHCPIGELKPGKNDSFLLSGTAPVEEGAYSLFVRLYGAGDYFGEALEVKLTVKANALPKVPPNVLPNVLPKAPPNVLPKAPIAKPFAPVHEDAKAGREGGEAEALVKNGKLPPEMKNPYVQVKMVTNLDADKIIQMLKKHDGNPNAAINEFFS